VVFTLKQFILKNILKRIKWQISIYVYSKKKKKTGMYID